MKQTIQTDKRPTIIKVDKNLDKYLNKGLFKDKIDKANEGLKTVGLPKFSKWHCDEYTILLDEINSLNYV